MLKVIEFIQANQDWENLLKASPYSLHVNRKDNFISFAYNQIESDFKIDLVKECRGLILEDKTFKIVCCPFFKFFNYGEGQADKIDWSTARIQEKVDGSLIKVWCHEGFWHVSTNGMIDANDAGLNSDIDTRYKTFYDLFMQAVQNSKLEFRTLNPDCTHMFELISPLNRVVVTYTETEIRHIGTRNNLTLQESDEFIGIKQPEVYSFATFEDVLENCSKLPFQKEGYVVVDANWKRVKVKSTAYLAVHHLKGNGNVSKHRILELIRKNEKEEFLNYFPEYKKYFDEIEPVYFAFLARVEKDLVTAFGSLDNHSNGVISFATRKDYALWVIKNAIYPPIMFQFYDKKVTLGSFKEKLDEIPSDKMVEILKLKD